MTRRISPPMLVCPGVLFACAAAFGQHPVAADGLPCVAPAIAGRAVSSVRAFSQGIAADAAGRLWCLVVETPHPGGRHLWLHRSDDDGVTWAQRTEVPHAWGESGAIGGDPARGVLHVAFGGGMPGDKFMSAMCGTFDTENGVWLGEPVVLQQGSNEADQYDVWDLAVARDGSPVVMVSTRRAPKMPPWKSGWATGLFTCAVTDGAWRGPFQVNAQATSSWGNLQIDADRVHASYRVGHRQIAYRSFSLSKAQFEQEGDVLISDKLPAGQLVSNANSLIVDEFGGRTILFPVAGPKTELGRLAIAHAAAGAAWQMQTVALDPELGAGELAHEHAVLVRGPGMQAIALYSKATEQHRVLYRRIFESGRAMEPERVVATSLLAGAYARIVAMRDPRVVTRLWAVVAGQGNGAVLGVRAVLGSGEMRTRWWAPSR